MNYANKLLSGLFVPQLANANQCEFITMQLYPNRLPPRCRQLPGFVLVFGEEPQQKLDSIAMIRQQAQQQGFDERQSLVADAQFEWSRFIEASQTMSLFAAKQVIELELPTGKPGKEGSKTLLTLAEQNNPDILFIIHGPKVGKDVTATKWFKTLDKQGWYIPCYALEGDRLRSWLNDTMRQHGLQPSAPVTQFLWTISKVTVSSQTRNRCHYFIPTAIKPKTLKSSWSSSRALTCFNLPTRCFLVMQARQSNYSLA